ncbi:MAG: alpha/beta-hydrolase family protein [Actinobacteria bacterium]|nr:alpha/beta-hydrolase family protein [Actinomycetota bacterium]
MSGSTDTAQTDAPLNRIFTSQLSGPGVAVALFFFGLSLQPSLLPRTALFQGVVSGVTMMIGYGLGVVGQWAWNYLGLPKPEPASTAQKVVLGVTVVVVGFVAAASIWRQVGWQNDVREIFGMESISPSVWLLIVPITLAVAAVILILSRAVRKLFQLIARWLNRIMPQRVARLVGGLALFIVLGFLINGVLLTGFFLVANSAFSVRDTATVEGMTEPQTSERSGSPQSLIAWESLGRQGRSFVASGPTVEELNVFQGGGAMEPIRIYAGLKSADTLQQRADLVLEDLKRAGAFERDLLVVATTTGTGFLVPEAMNTLEYVHNGDTAIVGVQYSYLPSWISLLADQEVTRETSRVVFDTIHDYWSTLPPDSRPDIYLFGLSLGSLGVESILTSVNIINEPINGALLTGPPFVNDMWDEITDDRDAGSPAWLPIYQDGRTVRFTSLDNALDVPRGEWDDTKIVYLQHASDPVSFFSPDLAFSEPDWLKEGQRGPDVSAQMAWFPLVTMWQVALDLPAAGNVPAGHGHLYTSSEYLNAWLGVTQPEGWTASDTDALRDHLNTMDQENEDQG